MTQKNEQCPRRVVVGISGATGVVLAARCLHVLGELGIERHAIISPAGKQTILYEAPNFNLESNCDVLYSWRDIGAPISSGSFSVDSMIVVPCSARTLASIASGGGDNLLSRAADVTLKERRRLVLGFRETPLHQGHIRAMRDVTEMGAIVCPPLPPFYLRPKSISDMINRMTEKLLSCAGIDVPGAPYWHGSKKRKESRLIDSYSDVGDPTESFS